jgi:hypothetical protein
LKAGITNSSSAPATPRAVNIGPRGRRQRRIFGGIFLVAAFLLVAWLVDVDASRWWRVLAWPLLWLSAIGLLQAQMRTCVAHAARGTCDADVTPPSAEQQRTLRATARRIVRTAALLATAATLAALMIA